MAEPIEARDMEPPVEAPATVEWGGTWPVQRVPLKAYRTEARVTVVAPMPGLEPEDLGIDVSEGMVRIHGRLRGELKGEAGKEILVDEWNPGPYEAELPLPVAVDAPAANITFKNGVLVAVLPITGESRDAHLSVAATGPAEGKRVGFRGHPNDPATTPEKRAEERAEAKMDRELGETFPASDPLAATSPLTSTGAPE